MSEESKSEKKKEDWMNSKWRPMMGWMYMVVCTMDMVVFPILWSILQTFNHQQITQWNPLTLQGAGLFHIAMGAVLGLAAWGRTQEKLGGANNGGATPPSTSGFAASSVPSTGGFGAPSSFGTPAPVTGGFGTQSMGSGGGFGSAPSSPSTGGFGSNPTQESSVTVGFGGKPAPVQPPQPLI
jgi:hypothetical protein